MLSARRVLAARPYQRYALYLGGAAAVCLLVSLWRGQGLLGGADRCGFLGGGGGAPRLDLDFQWAIYITPQGFQGPAAEYQRRAIASWLRLKPRPRIVLLGKGAGYEEVAAEHGLTINPHIDLNFVEMPLAGSVLDVATRPSSEISVLINSDILLTQSFVDAMARVRSRFDSWFMSGARIDLDELPSALEFHNERFDEATFVNYAQTTGVLHTAGGVDYFAWNNDGRQLRLFKGVMPPFIRGKSKFDNWIVHEVVSAGFREAVDTTGAVVAVHVKHDYVTGGQDVRGRIDLQGSSIWQRGKADNWQVFHNNHLAAKYGTYRNQDGTTVHSPWKLTACAEATGTCFLRRLRPGTCPCEHSPTVLKTQTDPTVVQVYQQEVKRQLVKCASVSSERPDRFRIHVLPPDSQPPTLGLPFTLRDLLPLVATNNHVIVTGASYNYRDMVMNFVCNLRRLGIYKSLVIAAFDEEMYRFGFQLGLPIFFYQSESTLKGGAEMDFGGAGFKDVTKLKSRVVLQVIRLGYDATWTDTDIVWFQNPLPALSAMESDFVVQSNAPFPEEKEANGMLRINSGFYRVRSTPTTVAAMELIVSHAAASSRSEQPSFYIVLCGGEEGRFRLGHDACAFRYTTDFLRHPDERPLDDQEPLVVRFLDRLAYPNGAVGRIWESRDIASDFPGLVILHNNWIRGFKAKTERLVHKGFWFFNRQKLICDYSPRPSYTMADLDGIRQ